MNISDQKQRWGNYQRSVVIGAVMACRLAVATHCERGISPVHSFMIAGFSPVQLIDI